MTPSRSTPPLTPDTGTRRRWLGRALSGILAGAMLAATPGLHAADDTVTVAGQPFVRRLQLAGSELQLNGTGVRGWYKAYAAGLYLVPRVIE